MQITIDIPDELSNIIRNKGKALDVAIIEALGLYIQYNEPTHTHQPEGIDWLSKWEQWFTECEAVITTTQPTTNPPIYDDYTTLLVDKYRKQGLEL